MALSDVRICNMALAHLGHTKFIANLETERTLAAEICNEFYEEARNFVLEDFPWSFARKYLTLGLVTDYTAVTTPHDWDYAYRYPDDCIFFRRIVTTNGRQETTPPPFAIGSDDSGRLVYTDEEDAVGEYTKLITDPTLVTAQFAEALSWYLAGMICPGLAKDRKKETACFQMYEISKGKAARSSGNEQQQTPEPESEFVRARE